MLLNSTDIDNRTGIFARHFDTFSSGRFIVIHKEPLKTISNINTEIYAGYGDTSTQEVTYTPVSGSFPVMTVYDKNANQAVKVQEIQTSAAQTKLRIKVKEDARRFIKNGKNQSFEIDGLTFNGIGEESVQNYFGLKYYYFTLISTS